MNEFTNSSTRINTRFIPFPRGENFFFLSLLSFSKKSFRFSTRRSRFLLSPLRREVAANLEQVFRPRNLVARSVVKILRGKKEKYKWLLKVKSREIEIACGCKCSW